MARTYSALDALPRAYDRLLATHAGFFSSRTWYENFAATALEPGERPLLFGLEADDAARTALALLPMKARGPGGLLHGRELTSLTSYYSPIYAPLLDADPGARRRLLRQLAQALRASRPRSEAVELRPLDRDSPVFGELVAALRAAGFVVQTYFCFGNWTLDVGGRSWEEYAKSLPSKLRNTLQRKHRSLTKAGRLRFEILRAPGEIEPGIAAWERIYAASWKQREPFESFVPGLVRACARDGCLRLGLLYLDGEAVAAQIWIVSGGTASIFKLAYDEQHSKLSVGSLLSAHLFEHALDVDRVAVVDYLSGDDAYKRDWMSHRRELWGIVAFDPLTARGLVRAVANLGGRALKTAWGNLRSARE